MRTATRLSLLVLALAFLLGTSAERCAPTQEAICPLRCEHGLKQDSQGRAYCECRPAEACILVVPPPARNPQSGECVYFPTVCDLPEGWKPCGPGCRVGDRFVPVGGTLPADDGCNSCTCLRGGGLACTDRACPVCEVDGRIYRPGDSFPDGDGCNTCSCLENGQVVCSLRPCPPLCPPSPEQLCVQSGGRWDPLSCGHYRCGAFPECDAIIPGCDCGPGRTFHPVVGCAPDPTCSGCDDCPAGSVCNDCPPDPDCAICAVCGSPRCEPLVCAFDEDCPEGSHCEGSSVCPPDVVCIWEGEPGVCVPDAKCCDPRLEPGVGGNPFCFEGASCCADGQWACNRGDLTPTCEALGQVCR